MYIYYYLIVLLTSIQKIFFKLIKTLKKKINYLKKTKKILKKIKKRLGLKKLFQNILLIISYFSLSIFFN